MSEPIERRIVDTIDLADDLRKQQKENGDDNDSEKVRDALRREKLVAEVMAAARAERERVSGLERRVAELEASLAAVGRELRNFHQGPILTQGVGPEDHAAGVAMLAVKLHVEVQNLRATADAHIEQLAAEAAKNADLERELAAVPEELHTEDEQRLLKLVLRGDYDPEELDNAVYMAEQSREKRRKLRESIFDATVALAAAETHVVDKLTAKVTVSANQRDDLFDLLPKDDEELSEIHCAISAARKLGVGVLAQAWMDRVEAYLRRMPK